MEFWDPNVGRSLNYYDEFPLHGITFASIVPINGEREIIVYGGLVK